MSRLKAGSLASGLGMGMQVLDAFIKEIVAAGGNPSDLEFLARPAFKENLTRVANAFVACEWKFPVSKIRDLAEQEYRQEHYLDNDEFIGHARHRVWKNALFRMGIPHTAFSNVSYRNPEFALPSIPYFVLEWLDGKEVTYPLLADHWVVTDWVTKDQAPLIAGDVIKADELVSLIISDQKYFDFER